MFTKVDIGNFGSFGDFEWNKSLRDTDGKVQNFKRLNILYGRNYSGKTTLSRIFRALETGHLPSDYASSTFTLSGEEVAVTPKNLVGHGYNIRVYNRDFISENLSFVANKADGEVNAKAFAIVGEKNKEIEDKIATIQAKLGSVEAKVGLLYELNLKKTERDQKKQIHVEARRSLDDKLRSHANKEIKNNRTYGNANYNIEKIEKDIDAVMRSEYAPLTAEEQQSKIDLVNQTALKNIATKVSIKLKINGIKKESEELLSRAVKPTQAIQELLNETALQEWVKQGVSLHKDKRKTCAFCRQDLPDDIWQVLDLHFSQESKNLEDSIDNCLSSIKGELQQLPKFLNLTADEFYPEEKILFEAKKKTLNECLKVYEDDLNALRDALEQRKAGLFQTVPMPSLKHEPDVIYRCVDDITAIVNKNNERTNSLDTDENKARELLRLNDVHNFIRNIGYKEELTRIAELETEAKIAEERYTKAAGEVRNLEADVDRLQGQRKDERKGAERVNGLLNQFFGHEGIKLEAKDDGENKAVKFEITRDGRLAYNLSDGECSLIAFCYFIAKLEEPDSKDKDLIIYIDDPISSLDGNHIFFMFSLIEGLIARPIKNEDGSNRYRYKQLFISTHNLDFLKYLKRLSLPSNSHGGYQHFILEKNRGPSQLRLMPAYLKDYITEFNYLFHQIYKSKNPPGENDSHEPFYGFGNNLRKFLEAFLFFKYPHRDDKNDYIDRIKKFFGENDNTTVILVNRLNNEFSHLDENPERGMQPLEFPEISKIANYVLNKIFEADKTQYNALLKSMGEQERVQ